MARTNHYGPLIWVQPRGQNGLLPGQVHYWWAGTFPGAGGATFQVSAHPDRHSHSQELEIVGLSTVYGRTGGPLVNFGVRNAGTTGVLSYRIFISTVDF